MRTIEIEVLGMKYSITDNGRIYGKRGEITQRLNKDGYPMVTLGKGDRRSAFRVHRLVAQYFVSNDNPSDKTTVNHIDFNRSNNDYRNLEWISHSDNIRYSYKNNRHKGRVDGIKNPRCKHSEEEVRKIRSLYDTGKTISEIIYELYPNCSYKECKNKWSRVKDIATRKSFKSIN